MERYSVSRRSTIASAIGVAEAALLMKEMIEFSPDQLVMVFLVFAASLAFLYYAAATLKTRATWVKLHDQTEKQVNDLRLQLERLTRGDPLDVVKQMMKHRVFRPQNVRDFHGN